MSTLRDEIERPTRRKLPRVSVVIPCYNYGHYLPQVVDSVLSQPGVDVDVLIVDDASPDGSGQVARKLAEQDDRVAVIVHETNAGHIATYNEGLAAVDGEYVVLLSADDMLAPGALRRAVSLLEAQPSIGFVYGFSPEFEDVPPAPRMRERRPSHWSGLDWIERSCRRGRNFVMTPEVVMRTSVMRALEGYRADLPHSADFELWLRAAAIADVGRVNGADQAFYRQHGANMHYTDFGGTLRDLVERRRTFDVFFSSAGRALPDAQRLHTAALRRVALDALDHAADLVAAGRTDDGEADGLVDFATELSHDVTTTRQWRRLQRLRESGPLVATRRKAFRVRRDLAGRVRWRRWRRRGL